MEGGATEVLLAFDEDSSEGLVVLSTVAQMGWCKEGCDDQLRHQRGSITSVPEGRSNHFHFRVMSLLLSRLLAPEQAGRRATRVASIDPCQSSDHLARGEDLQKTGSVICIYAENEERCGRNRPK